MSVIANALHVYLQSEWLKPYLTLFVERRTHTESKEKFHQMQLALMCDNLASLQANLVELLANCVELEATIHVERWDGHTVSVRAPEAVVCNAKRLHGNAARLGQVLDSETATTKVLHHVEFMSYLLWQGYKHNSGISREMLTPLVCSLLNEAKRHRNGMRKQTLYFRHQSFIQHAQQVLQMYQTMHENHTKHVAFFGQVCCMLAAVLGPGAEMSRRLAIRRSLYTCSPFVDYMLEAFLVMSTLEHGVQRTQCYRELVLLTGAAKDASLAHMSGKIVSGLLEESGGVFAMLIAADKIQNAGVLRLQYSWQGAVIVSVLVDYLSFLNETNDGGWGATQAHLSRAEMLNDRLEEVEEEEEDDSDGFELELHESGGEDEKVVGNGAECVEPKKIEDLLTKVVVRCLDSGGYAPITEHTLLFETFARGVELVPLPSLGDGVEALEDALISRERRPILPEPMSNHRVLRSWHEEYVSLVTMRVDPSFLRDSSMMRRHSFSTVRTNYAPAHEEAASAELVRRQGLLFGKQPTDFASGELDQAVLAHLHFLKHISQPVSPEVQHAIRQLSQHRMLQEQAPLGLEFSTLLMHHEAQYEALISVGCRACVPVPCWVEALPCFAHISPFALPICSACKQALVVCSLVEARLSANGLLLSRGVTLEIGVSLGSRILACVTSHEVESIMFCQARDARQACQHSIALLTANLLNTSSTYTQEVRTQMFERGPK